MNSKPDFIKINLSSLKGASELIQGHLSTTEDIRRHFWYALAHAGTESCPSSR
ncbi:hypothetical protein M433DRAFT_148150 [Acidomyces richmondensis BFW]|nr:hypothetical protein M433DRAFT_148539 [Acidomyces richmondensis BFW]KYG40837.1 hypothetical protein M433DRAFT_148150 [Acidomyces richmondensis BFW]